MLEIIQDTFNSLKERVASNPGVSNQPFIDAFNASRQIKVNQVTPGQYSISVTLPDGSIITLYEGSKSNTLMFIERLKESIDMINSNSGSIITDHVPPIIINR